MAHKILLVEDEIAVRQMLLFMLEEQGFEVAQADNTNAALDYIADHEIDLIILDWMLPGISGVEMCRRMKKDKNNSDIPIIMLTAKADEENMIEGLDAGVDDYLFKPFSTRELLARINAVLRRSGKGSTRLEGEVFKVDGLVLDVGSHRVTADKKMLSVGPIEFKLLQFFMSHPDRVFSRTQLLDNVWGNDVYIEERTVDVHIRRLRKVLKVGNYEHLVQTVRGSGYRFSIN